MNRRIALFASACRWSVGDSEALEWNAQRILEDWRSAVGSCAAERPLAVLPGAPVVSVAGAAKLIGRSF